MTMDKPLTEKLLSPKLTEEMINELVKGVGEGNIQAKLDLIMWNQKIILNELRKGDGSPACSECGNSIRIGYAESYGHLPTCSQATLKDQNKHDET